MVSHTLETSAVAAAPVAPAVATPASPIVVPAVVTTAAPPVVTAVAAPLSVPITPHVPIMATPVVAAPADDPVVVHGIDAVPAQVQPPIVVPVAAATSPHRNPSPVALSGTATHADARADSTAHTGHALQSSLSNITLPAMPVFALHADPVPWLTGLRARLNLYNFTDAARVNVAVSLLTPEVQNVWAHAFPAGIACTFDDFCEWLASNFGKHDADDDIIRKLQTLRQRGKIAAYCAEFLALWNKLQNKPDESLQIKWFRQGLQQRVHDATLYDENNADWTSFSRVQAAVLRADARIHSHTSHYRETEPVRIERRMTPGQAPRPSGSF